MPVYVDLMKSNFSIPSKDLRDQFSKTVLKLANECDNRGLATKVYGDLDSQTKMCAIVHCIEDGPGTVAVSYAVKTLKTTEAREAVTPSLNDTPAMAECKFCFISPIST